MDLHNQAVNLIEMVAQRLDPLFRRYNFHMKFRESDPSIFAEHLKYESAQFLFTITACLHPHDYPYSLSIQLIDKNYTHWKYINQQELTDEAQKICSVHKSGLLVATDFQVQRTLEELYEILKCILENIVNIK